ncbi:hypothetical protein B0H13DRAFT_1905853 [Mycena leptocephala]|nr:hypothetical protein B0H13DRAFT_1905853 [Mycena leptocephala]
MGDRLSLLTRPESSAQCLRESCRLSSLALFGNFNWFMQSATLTLLSGPLLSHLLYYRVAATHLEFYAPSAAYPSVLRFFELATVYVGTAVAHTQRDGLYFIHSTLSSFWLPLWDRVRNTRTATSWSLDGRGCSIVNAALPAGCTVTPRRDKYLAWKADIQELIRMVSWRSITNKFRCRVLGLVALIIAPHGSCLLNRPLLTLSLMSIYLEGNIVPSVGFSLEARTLVSTTFARSLRLPQTNRLLLTTAFPVYGTFSTLVQFPFLKSDLSGDYWTPMTWHTQRPTKLNVLGEDSKRFCINSLLVNLRLNIPRVLGEEIDLAWRHGFRCNGLNLFQTT